MTNLSILMRKKDVAALIPCSLRQVELLVQAGKIPQPFYVSDASPRWRRSDIDAWLERLAAEAQNNDEVAR